MHRFSSDGLQKLQPTLSARGLKQRLICFVLCWRASNFNMFLYKRTATVLLHSRLGRIAVLQNWPQIKWRPSTIPADAEYPSTETTTYIVVCRTLVFYMFSNKIKNIYSVNAPPLKWWPSKTPADVECPSPQTTTHMFCVLLESS